MVKLRISLLAVLAIMAVACSSGNSSTTTPDIQDDSGNLSDVLTDEDSGGSNDSLVSTDAPIPEEVTADQVAPADIDPDICTPACTGAKCGEDGCGGSCGDCGAAGICFEGGCVECVDDNDCATDRACEEYQCVPDGCPEIPCEEGLFCLTESAECVDCLEEPDCPAFHQCVDQLCVPPPACESSKDCPDDTVCDKGKGYCLQCVTDDDCPLDHRCIETQICELILFCGSDKECKEFDKVCDLGIGECVDCLSDFDCPDNYFCAASVCLLDLCDQNGEWPACIEGNVAACNENGSLLAIVETCPEATFCADATCHPWVCEPEGLGCAESIAFECNEDGSGFKTETDCADSDEACSGGECKPVVCEPGIPVCLDPLTLVTCSETGTDFVTEPCGEGFFCDDKSAACLGWVCAPESKGCDGETSLTCDEFGTEWGDPVECDAEGLFCESGECVECDPACGDRECGPDACGGSCGNCEAPGSCLVGYCQNQTCPTPCNGKTPEAFLCGLDICYPDLVTETEVIAPFGDAIDQMFNVQAKYGEEGNDLVPGNAPSFAIMATGKIANTQHNDQMPPNQCGTDPIKEGKNCDVVTGTMKLTAPAGATGFSLDFVFLTKEVEIQNPYDDRFYILLKAPQTTNGETWVINFMPCLPKVDADFTFEEVKYCYIRALSGFAVNPSPLNLAGTAFLASTSWLRTSWEILPGESFSLTFRVADWQDGQYDSAAIIDNFQWLFTPIAPNTVALP
jgi:hypothetical protein